MVPVTRKRVTVFRRKLSDGSESLFINYRINGKRIREPLNLYLNKGTTARQKIENSNILAMAEEYARKKSRELEEADLGVFVSESDHSVMFIDYACSLITHSRSPLHAARKAQGIRAWN